MYLLIYIKINSWIFILFIYLLYILILKSFQMWPIGALSAQILCPFLCHYHSLSTFLFLGQNVSGLAICSLSQTQMSLLSLICLNGKQHLETSVTTWHSNHIQVCDPWTHLTEQSTHHFGCCPT